MCVRTHKVVFAKRPRAITRKKLICVLFSILSRVDVVTTVEHLEHVDELLRSHIRTGKNLLLPYIDDLLHAFVVFVQNFFHARRSVKVDFFLSELLAALLDVLD